jgi:hypothetical protein
MARTNTLFGRANVLQSEHKGGEVRLTIGDAQTDEGEAQSMPMWGLPGFVSMPDAHDENGACQVLYLDDGPHRIGVAFRDNRYADKSGAPKPGDRMITSSGNARFLIKRTDDSTTMYTANEPDGGSSMIITQNGKSGETVIVNGPAMFRMKTDEIVMTVGGSSITIDAGGITMFGPHIALNSSSGNLGSMGLIPPPQGLSSLLAGPSGMVGAPSLRWTVMLVFVFVMNLARMMLELRGGYSAGA